MRRFFHAVILAILFCLFTCGEEQDEPQLTNPFDPENPETQGDPFHLSVKLKERKSVLTWKEPLGCEFDNYIIYRRVGNDTEVKIATVPRGTTRYTDTTIVAGHQYTYRINVARSTKQSPLSRITDKSSVYLNVLPTVTINPLEIDGNDVTISWSATDDDGEVVGYSYRFNNGDWSQYLADTKHTFKDLKAGKHTVEVKAKDNAQDEGPITQRVFTLTIDFAVQLTIVWYVSTTGDDTTFKTIQKGIDAASDGDIVLVADGTYTGDGNKNLDFKGKAITVKSENGAENCIIDCENDGRGFYFHNDENEASVLDGFTIRNGRTRGPDDSGGGGILCEYSSPNIQNNIIEGNKVSYAGGGGIRCYFSSAIITNNIISGNLSDGIGGGIECHYSSLTITNNIIKRNSAWSSGGGIECYSSSPIITNNTIEGNSAGSDGGGIYCTASSSITIINTILWNNNPEEIYRHHGSITVTYSNIQGGWPGEGNINADPLFVDPAKGDYHLQPGSPCVDSATGKEAPTTDIDGHPRLLGSGYDMGAYER
ncbi:DUF1565 domain-containing protein [Candidatus Poribacteria bacterium]|nr:DUF1565 domain-containing protein [Candidatus Poribacteria bacterium]